MTDAGHPPAGAVSAAVVAAHLEALNLTGLSFAVRRLVGKDPQPVTGQFAMWARQDSKGLPPVTRAYWKALAPLRISRPQTPAAAVCEEVLRGRERDGALALTAAGDCASQGKQRFTPLPTAPDGDQSDLSRKALVNAVKDYWRAVGTMYGEVRGPVVAGDLQTAVGQIRRSEPTLREIVEQVAALAAAVAAAGPPDTSDDAATGAGPDGDSDPRAVAELARAQAVADPLDAVPLDAAFSEPGDDDELLAYVEDEPLEEEGHDPVAARAQAFAQQRPLHAGDEEDLPPRPVQVLSRRPVRNHVILPIVFALCVTGLAMYVIFAVLNAPNPLTQ
ncbi:hypothetical protein BH23ACT9_BH23ACT9_07630 [soil metagenome]